MSQILDQFLGQRDTIAPLLVAIAASERTGRPLPHALFLGGPGRGKTTLARAVADDMELPFSVMHGSSTIERQTITDKIMEAKGGILFIDEIHALPRQISEELYRVMDDGKLSIPRNKTVTTYRDKAMWFDRYEDLPEHERWQWPYKGAGYYMGTEAIERKSKETEVELVDVSPVTVLGATTDEALLPEPFYSRLSSLIVRLRPYDNEELAAIAVTHAQGLNMQMDYDAAIEVASRSRSTPRKVKQLTERIVDWNIATDGDGLIRKSDVRRVLNTLGIDQYGLAKPHRDVLAVLGNAPKGLSRTSLAQQLRIPPRNVELYWAELAESGFVSIDTRHRITEQGRNAY